MKLEDGTYNLRCTYTVEATLRRPLTEAEARAFADKVDWVDGHSGAGFRTEGHKATAYLLTHPHAAEAVLSHLLRLGDVVAEIRVEIVPWGADEAATQSGV